MLILMRKASFLLFCRCYPDSQIIHMSLRQLCWWLVCKYALNVTNKNVFIGKVYETEKWFIKYWCTPRQFSNWALAHLVLTGSYSEWLKCHPDHLRSVLPVLLGGLSQEQLSSASTQALRGICEECVQDLELGTLMEILSHCQVNIILDLS